MIRLMRMSKVFLRVSIGLILGFLAFHEAWAINRPPAHPLEGVTADYVCPPRLHLRHPQRCPEHGPSAQITELARKGLYLPKPIPVAAIDSSYLYIPFEYVRASSKVNLYPSVDAAASRSGSIGSVGTGFVFLSYAGAYDQGGVTIYGTVGGFVRSDQVSKIDPPPSPGLAFERTPERPVAWIINGGTCSQKTPGGLYNDQCFTRHALVQIYDRQNVDGWDWYQIGIDAWIEQRNLAVVKPDGTPPEGVDSDRWINVNLYEQTVEAYQAGELVFATVVSTGQYGTWTQPGLYQVWAKLERDVMTGGVSSDEGGNYYYLEDVPWVLYFDQSRALHGTYWHARFGVPSSRGCVNLAPIDARWIYEFAEEGSWIYVFDPSGNTPTDPSLYGPGGA